MPVRIRRTVGGGRRRQIEVRLRRQLAGVAQDLATSFLESQNLDRALERLHAIAQAETATASVFTDRLEQERGTKQASARVARIIEDVLGSWAGRLFDRFRVEYVLPLEESTRRAYSLGAEAAITRVGLRGSFDLRNPRILASIEERANMLTGGVADSTFEAIKERIADVFWEQRKGPPDVAKALREEFAFLTKPRSILIARTETLVAQESGTFKQYQEIGVARKAWLDTNDGRTRPTHVDAGERYGERGIPLEDPFEIGDALLMFPGDPAGPPEEICNCRCASAPVVSEEDFSGPWDGR